MLNSLIRIDFPTVALMKGSVGPVLKQSLDASISQRTNANLLKSERKFRKNI